MVLACPIAIRHGHASVAHATLSGRGFDESRVWKCHPAAGAGAPATATALTGIGLAAAGWYFFDLETERQSKMHDDGYFMDPRTGKYYRRRSR